MLFRSEARVDLLARWPEVRQILTLGLPHPEGLGGPEISVPAARAVNDGLAEACKRYPGKFPAFVASLPMNNVPAAIEEMDRAIGELGACGIQVFTNVNGRALDVRCRLPSGYDALEPSLRSAAAAALGHVYPVWWEFRGGKGAATLIGVLLGSTPAALIPVLSVWLVSVIVTGYVGLSTMLGVMALPAVLLLHGGASVAALVFAISMAVFVIYTHRGNIERMRAGNEHRARRLWYRSYFKGSDV